MTRKPKPEATESVDLLGSIPEPYQTCLTNLVMPRWNEIAAFSYHSFLTKRRGLVLLDFIGDELEYDYISWKRLKAEWEQIMHDSDEIIRTLIRHHLPQYNPETEFVVLLTYTADGDSLVMKVTGAAASTFSQPTQSVIPTLQRYEYPPPKKAYEQLFG